MKKKTMLSKEALNVMLGAEESVPAEGQELNTETTAKEAIKSEEEVATEENATEEKAEEEVPTILASEMEAVQKELEDFKAASTETIEKAEAEVVEAKEELEAVTVSAEEVKTIVVGNIANMRVALSIAAVDMTSWTMEAVVTEFKSTSDSFKKSYPVGGIVPEHKETTNKTEAVKSSTDASEYESLGFK